MNNVTLTQASPEPRPALPPEATDIIKPIDTRYAGCRFRSRLEARWAVFFDHLGIEWQYEPECFRVAGKGYLPDFWLPKLGLWAEVKGVLDAATFDHLIQAVDPRSGLPASPAGDPWRASHRTGRMLLLGQIPQVRDGAGWVHSRLDFSHGQPVHRWAAFLDMPGRSAVQPLGDGDTLYDRNGHLFIRTDDQRLDALDGCPVPVLSLDSDVIAAYRAARMSRFEHGESGTPVELTKSSPVPKPRRKPAKRTSTSSTSVGISALQETPIFSDSVPMPVPNPPARKRKAS